MPREIEEFRHLLRSPTGMAGIGKSTGRVAELIKERMAHSFNSRKTLGRRVFEQRGNEVNCLWRRPSKHLLDDLVHSSLPHGVRCTLLKGCGLI